MSQKIIILINAKVKMTVPQEDHAIIKNVKEIQVHVKTLQNLLIKLVIKSKLLKLVKEELMFNNVVMNQKINQVEVNVQQLKIVLTEELAVNGVGVKVQQLNAHLQNN